MFLHNEDLDRPRITLFIKLIVNEFVVQALYFIFLLNQQLI